MRFYVVGFVEGKGYAIKDLKDGVIEFFSREKVLEMSKIVKIYGVNNNDIDLDWFRSFYAKSVLAIGEEETMRKFCIGLDQYNRFSPYYHNEIEANTDFFEMSDTDALFLEFGGWNSFQESLSDSRSDTKFSSRSKPLLYDDYNISSVGTLPFCLLNKFNIQRIIRNGAVITFWDRLDYATAVIENLRMVNCTYAITRAKRVFLINKHKNTYLKFTTFFNESKFYICNNCNLDNIHIEPAQSYPEIFIEDEVDISKVYNLFKCCTNTSKLVVKRFKFNRDMI